LVEKPADGQPSRWRPGLGLSALQTFVGYGIGDYAFRAAGWVSLAAATLSWNGSESSKSLARVTLCQ
jgi:hypothetical protein